MPLDDFTLQEIRNAIQTGDRARAKDLLTRQLRSDPNDAETWLWMSAVVDTPRERIYCLKEAVRVDPANPAAKRGLAMFGAAPVDPGLAVPLEMQQRDWQTSLEKAPGPSLTIPRKHLWLFGGGALVVIALILVAVLSGPLSRAKPAVVHATIDYNPVASATSATGSPPPPTATNTPSGPTPPWNVLAAPYTPTPAYVRTPHTRIEAYSIAVRAIDRQEWDKALDYMIQAATSQPDAADLPYQIGELYRTRGDYARAIESYTQSIAIDQLFAPAYLGRAQAMISAGSRDAASIRNDVQVAVNLDPILAEARLELARLDLQDSNFAAALEQLDAAEILLPGSPWTYLLRGQVFLAQSEPAKALEQAKRANQLDLTLLPVYRLTGEALQATGAMADSIVPLEIYLRYNTEPDAGAQIMISRAYAAAGELDKAVAAVTAALEIVPGDMDVLLLRGDYYLQNNQPEQALADYREALRIEPASFAAGVSVGKAQFVLGAYRDAYLQLNRFEKLAKSNEQKAQLYYWRAQALEKINEPAAALKDWQRLLDLPVDAVPAEWRESAQQHISALVTPTPTQVATPR